MDNARLNEVFGEAFDLQGAQRAEYLKRACADDPALRARVESLLTAAEKDDPFLASPERNGPPTEAPFGEGPGDRIGPYLIIERIGEGGFGTVFLAEQQEPVKRSVALKIIKLGMDTRMVVARFEQERQALAIMDHPNIAKVLDAGSTSTGRPYFVMELVRGEPITAYCDKNNLTIEARVDLFTQVCQAVQHAHTKGVIHRDLKPSNVLVSVHDGRPVARVIDFGIAKATDHAAAERTAFTEGRQLIGTPEYMSPEQAAGGPDIDTRTDVYSLGVLLYELLTSSTPFDPRTLRIAAYGELQRLIREVDPPRPSTRLAQSGDTLPTVAAHRRVDPGRLNSLVRGELDWIVMKALEKDRARRYDSPSALATDLQRYLSGQAVSAAPPSTVYRFRKFVRRNRGPVIAGGLVAAALIAGIVGTSVGLARERTAHAEATAAAELARQNAARATEEATRADREAREATLNARMADAANAMMTRTIERANRAREGGRADLTVREVMDAAAKDLESNPGKHEPKVELLLAKTIGQTYRELSLFEPAERMLRLAADRAAQLSGDKSVEYGQALSDLGSLLQVRGQSDAATALFDRAEVIFSAAGDAGAESLAALGLHRAELAASRDKLDEAEAHLRRAVAFYESHNRTQADDYTPALHDLADVLFRKGDTKQAGELLHRVIDLERQRYGEDDPRTIESLHGLTAVQFATQDPAAEATLRQELAAARRFYGDKHHETSNLLHSLGTILISKGDVPGAEAALREALAINTAVYGPNHPETAEQAQALGTVLVDGGRDAEAEPILRQALAAFTSTPEGNSRWSISALYAAWHLGGILERRGALVEAEPFIRAAIEHADQSFKTGEKYEWMTHAMRSLLADILLARAKSDSPTPADAQARLAEAERLAYPAAARLQELAPKMGPKTRRQMIGRALTVAAGVADAANAAEPTRDHAATAAQWHAKKDEFEKPQSAPK